MVKEPMPESEDFKGYFYIMIIDDEKDFLDSMAYWFTSQGYRVRTFMSGEEALASIKEKKPGIIFLNLQMPQAEGIKTLEAIKDLDVALPIIMLSAFGAEDASVDAYKLGVNGFFDKSSNFYKAEHLINTYVRVLARQHGVSPHPVRQRPRLNRVWKWVVLVAALAIALFAANHLAAPQVCFKEGACLRLELATTDAQREKGLMARESLGEDRGMLFVFPEQGTWNFWMKNTNIPLDILWMDASGRVVTIERDVQPSDEERPPIFSNDRPAKYALEANAGFAAKHGIAVGDQAQIR